MALEYEGYEVTESSSGQEALALIEQEPYGSSRRASKGVTEGLYELALPIGEELRAVAAPVKTRAS